MVAELSPRRFWNAARKLVAGLPLGSEAVWPGLRNDLFVAHESIYGLAVDRAHGARVLDAACGTGYGSFLLAREGAESVVGIDRNARRVRFAARHYQWPGLRFHVADCEQLDFPPDSFDVVVSSNTLEHLREPVRFLRKLGASLSGSGELLVAVPPVVSERDVVDHARNAAHLSNLSVRGWNELFEREGWKPIYISHRCAKPLDFTSYRLSTIAPRDFTFLEEDVDEAYRSVPITAIFRLRRAG